MKPAFSPNAFSMTPLPPAVARISSVPPSLRLLGIALAGLFLVGCTSAGKQKTSGPVDPRIATPPHNLSAAEYPFDDDGTYRKDWVANPAAARRSGRRTQPAPAPSSPPPAPARQQAPGYAYQPPPSAPVNPAPYPAAPAPRPTAPPPAPKPAPAPPKPAAARYHTVVKGDTLFSISRKYNVTVPKLKSTNGLSSDTIRIGQTLRVP